MIAVPSSLQRKSFPHRCLRGLNKRTRRPVTGSLACTRIPLNSLEKNQTEYPGSDPWESPPRLSRRSFGGVAWRAGVFGGSTCGRRMQVSDRRPHQPDDHGLRHVGEALDPFGRGGVATLMDCP
jgi:hypothetical protein